MNSLYTSADNFSLTTDIEQARNNILKDNPSVKGYDVNTKDAIEQVLTSKVNAIGFFSGAGGLDIGTQLAGAKIISSLDFDKDSVETMKSNDFFKHSAHFHKDIKDVSASDYSSLLKKNNPEKIILVGGPPCQPFSKAGYWVTNEKRKASEDPRNMIGNYLRVINDIKPDGFLLENVESILHPTNKIAVENLIEAIDQMGYHLNIIKSNALDYGVPQKRKRVFFVASKNTFKSELVKTHGSPKEILINPDLLPYENVMEWIGKFDTPDFFEKEEVTTGKTYSNELMAVPPGKNYLALTARDNYPDPKFIANTRFWNFLLKLHPEQPSWTISAQPGPWVGPFHWSGRRLRVPEIAALQTFPEDYIYSGSRRSIQKQIGNAVPSILGKAMVNHLIANL
jgi:DNA (cytosine-5)-methyltransferase 1